MVRWGARASPPAHAECSSLFTYRSSKLRLFFYIKLFFHWVPVLSRRFYFRISPGKWKRMPCRSFVWLSNEGYEMNKCVWVRKLFWVYFTMENKMKTNIINFPRNHARKYIIFRRFPRIQATHLCRFTCITGALFNATSGDDGLPDRIVA